MTHMQKTRSEEWVVTPNLLHLCFFLSCPDIGSRLFRIKQGIGAEKSSHKIHIGHSRSFFEPFPLCGQGGHRNLSP